MDSPRNIISVMQRDGLSLEFVKKQSEEICIAAVNSNWKALQYVKNQTNKICALAININPNALQFVRNQTNELCHLALTKDVPFCTEVKLRLIFVQNASVKQYQSKVQST